MKPALLLLALASLAACGRVGPPTPPGPTSEVTYPRFYPKPDTPQAPGTRAQQAPGPVVPLVVPITR